MIQLKNIDLTNVTFVEEMEKVKEENEEFEQAIYKYDIDNAIEEFWDSVQSKLGALEYLGVDASKVMKEYPKHLEKIKNRPRDKED